MDGSATFEPNDRIFLELGYDYSDDFSQILVCFVSTPGAGWHRQVPGLDRPERRTCRSTPTSRTTDIST